MEGFSINERLVLPFGKNKVTGNLGERMKIRRKRFRRKWPRLFQTTTENALAVGEGAREPTGRRKTAWSLIVKTLPQGKPEPGAKGQVSSPSTETV